ncbi:unnamed protein product [Blepharisma stoltei]|uniref:Uncharacterized protein n=1 Tax=Blepharisma stoltei TaxID=1481888 RepID=A0AAU9K6R2_9CILI|nr:unnamed protein product [Blepharisma stoltei]
MNITTGCIFFRQQRELMELCLYFKFFLKSSIKNLLFGFLNFIKMEIVTLEKLKLWKIRLAASFSGSNKSSWSYTCTVSFP